MSNLALQLIEREKEERSGKVRPGEEWDNEIKRALAASDIIFLLLSPDFLATDYICNREWK